LKPRRFRGDIPAFMRGLWLEAQSLRLRDDLPLPSLPRGEALVRVTLAGICNTDLELVGGYYPFTGVLGHEFVGRVERAPDHPEWVGRRVVGEINASCGACPACRAGRPTHCENRTVLGIKARHGAFAEYLALPVANLHAVPDTLPDEVAVFAEPTAAAFEVQQQVRISRGDRVVVIGPGKLGSLVAQSLASSGCDLVAIGRSRSSLDRLALLGIKTALAVDVPVRSADVVVECTGNPDGLALARKAVRPRGTIVLKSTYRGDTALNLSSIVVDEVTLVGSRCGPFDEALRALADGTVDVRALVETRYPLSGGLAAFEHASRPGALKVLVEC
jgi:threonine dehydrogenase-like Zn-dependent dehydrogenase